MKVLRIIPEFRILRLTFYLNKADSNGFFDMIEVYLKAILKLLISIGIVQVLRSDFSKFRILEILNFHPWI